MRAQQDQIFKLLDPKFRLPTVNKKRSLILTSRAKWLHFFSALSILTTLPHKIQTKSFGNINSSITAKISSVLFFKLNYLHACGHKNDEIML